MNGGILSNSITPPSSLVSITRNWSDFNRNDRQPRLHYRVSDVLNAEGNLTDLYFNSTLSFTYLILYYDADVYFLL